MIPTLREALARVEAGDVPETCLCLLRGRHIVDDSIEVKGRGFIVTISGCGPNTQVILRGGRILFNGFAAVKIRDLEIQAYDLTDEAGLMFRECRSITINDCTLFAWESRNGLVRIGPGSQRILLGRDNIQMLEGQQFRFLLDALANIARSVPARHDA